MRWISSKAVINYLATNWSTVTRNAGGTILVVMFFMTFCIIVWSESFTISWSVDEILFYRKTDSVDIRSYCADAQTDLKLLLSTNIYPKTHFRVTNQNMVGAWVCYGRRINYYCTYTGDQVGSGSNPDQNPFQKCATFYRKHAWIESSIRLAFFLCI